MTPRGGWASLPQCSSLSPRQVSLLRVGPVARNLGRARIRAWRAFLLNTARGRASLSVGILVGLVAFPSLRGLASASFASETTPLAALGVLLAGHTALTLAALAAVPLYLGSGVLFREGHDPLDAFPEAWRSLSLLRVHLGILIPIAGIGTLFTLLFYSSSVRTAFDGSTTLLLFHAACTFLFLWVICALSLNPWRTCLASRGRALRRVPFKLTGSFSVLLLFMVPPYAIPALGNSVDSVMAGAAAVAIRLGYLGHVPIAASAALSGGDWVGALAAPLLLSVALWVAIRRVSALAEAWPSKLKLLESGVGATASHAPAISRNRVGKPGPGQTVRAFLQKDLLLPATRRPGSCATEVLTFSSGSAIPLLPLRIGPDSLMASPTAPSFVLAVTVLGAGLIAMRLGLPSLGREGKMRWGLQIALGETRLLISKALATVPPAVVLGGVLALWVSTVAGLLGLATPEPGRTFLFGSVWAGGMTCAAVPLGFLLPGDGLDSGIPPGASTLAGVAFLPVLLASAIWVLLTDAGLRLGLVDGQGYLAEMVLGVSTVVLLGGVFGGVYLWRIRCSGRPRASR